jgi:hypothetical protein
MSIRHSDDDMLPAESPLSADLQVQSLSCDWGPVNPSCANNNLHNNNNNNNSLPHQNVTSCVSYSNLQEALVSILQNFLRL